MSRRRITMACSLTAVVIGSYFTYLDFVNVVFVGLAVLCLFVALEAAMKIRHKHWFALIHPGDIGSLPYRLDQLERDVATVIVWLAVSPIIGMALAVVCAWVSSWRFGFHAQ